MSLTLICLEYFQDYSTFSQSQKCYGILKAFCNFKSHQRISANFVQLILKFYLMSLKLIFKVFTNFMNNRAFQTLVSISSH